MALLKLPEPVTLSMPGTGLVVNLIQIYRPGSNYMNDYERSIIDVFRPKLYKTDLEITMAGWGITESGKPSTDLMTVTSNVLAFQNARFDPKYYAPLCYLAHRGEGEPVCRHLIRLRSEKYRGLCHGDSGGTTYIQNSSFG